MARITVADRGPHAAPALDIALSERNLVVLLSKLYTPGSRCSLVSDDIPPGYDHAVIRAEPDDLHYASPTREGAAAGVMHPLAELVRDAIQVLVLDAVAGDGMLIRSILDAREEAC